MIRNDTFYIAAERRIEYFTLGVGAAAATAGAVLSGWRVAAGILVGAVLAWVNYRWLKQGLAPLGYLVPVAVPETTTVRVPKSVYLKFAGRYALIVFALYVIFAYSLLPGAAVLGGLFSLAAAVVVEILYELMRRGESAG